EAGDPPVDRHAAGRDEDLAGAAGGHAGLGQQLLDSLFGHRQARSGASPPSSGSRPAPASPPESSATAPPPSSPSRAATSASSGGSSSSEAIAKRSRKSKPVP